MTLYSAQQLQEGATENMGMVGMVTQTLVNVGRRDPGGIVTTYPTASVTGPPVCQATHYGGTLPAPMGAVATEMSKITLETQRKNAREIFKFLNTQVSDLRDINGEYTLFTELLVATGTHQVKIFYRMGIITARIVQTSPIANKLLTLYGEGGSAIVLSQTYNYGIW